ncbi:metallophosphoesterase [cf. Phormidesmis sp. LEGE 11477]|uniref:metallophosphoesterase family protein n=1 Tax=cf. Phormidesmis sp. LEGE 11477 TaxID=1828680 RepID=UPI00187FDFA5|nr:metallophosphoesterase [cf. Phormidesmis sp. LEGE 11477]MBE9061956.1 metallophosphoesterase [cf. Phormidesmis sp. LEGE 11477]
MPLNRRRFVILSGLALGGAAATATSCSPSTPQANASDYSKSSANPTASTQPSSPASSLPHAPAPAGLYAPQRGDIRLAVISDLNSAYGSTDYRSEVTEGIAMLPDWQPDMVLCAGDMVAGQSLDLSASEIEAMWAAFDDQILSPIRAAGLPFAMTIGNHDASSYQRNGEFIYVLDRQETQKYWSGHQSDTDLTFVEASGFPFYYSFKQNDIFYLAWDASSANVPVEQVAWADRALSSPEAQSARLRIVMGHLPLYAVSQGRDRPGEYLNQADELQRLLERHNVHTYITGHHHAYFPGKSGQLNLLHCGALGSGPRSLLTANTAPYQTLTIMDIFLEAASVVYTTYNMNTQEVVNLQQLPRQIVGPTSRELRQDVYLEDLTPAEQSQQYVPTET